MPSGSHHHLKRLAVPTQWNLDKKSGKYAVRPLPGPHCKELSIPLKYVLARFLKIANTAKEIEYIAENKMISINGRDIDSVKFPVGLFDVITVKKTNQHYRIYLGANKKFKILKIASDEAQYRISKVVSKHTYEGIPLTHTMDGYNFKFANPSIEIDDTVKIDIKTNKIVSNTSLEVGKLAYVFSGPQAGRIGTVTKIDVAIDLKKTVFMQDKLGKIFQSPSNKLMTIGAKESPVISLEEDDGIRLNAFEISNNKYSAKENVEVEDN